MSDTKYVNGRRAFLQMFDTLLAEEQNIKLMREVLQDRLTKEPLQFIRDTVMPLLPKEGLIVSTDDDTTGQLTVVFKPAPSKAVSPNPT